MSKYDGSQVKLDTKERLFKDGEIEPRGSSVAQRPVSVTVFSVLSLVFLLAAFLLGFLVAPAFGWLSLGFLVSLGIAANINNKYNYQISHIHDGRNIRSNNIERGGVFSNKDKWLDEKEAKSVSKSGKKSSVSDYSKERVEGDALDDDKETNKDTKNGDKKNNEVVNEEAQTDKEKYDDVTKKKEVNLLEK